jgi:hypothetical protein
MQTPLNYFCNERTDPRTLDTVTRGLLAAHLKAYAQQLHDRGYAVQDRPVATANLQVHEDYAELTCIGIAAPSPANKGFGAATANLLGIVRNSG